MVLRMGTSVNMSRGSPRRTPQKPSSWRTLWGRSARSITLPFVWASAQEEGVIPIPSTIMLPVRPISRSDQPRTFDETVNNLQSPKESVDARKITLCQEGIQVVREVVLPGVINTPIIAWRRVSRIRRFPELRTWLSEYIRFRCELDKRT